MARKLRLHFADAVLQFPQRNAAGRFPVIQGQKKRPVRWRVFPRQRSKFFFESLEPKIDTEEYVEHLLAHCANLVH